MLIPSIDFAVRSFGVILGVSALAVGTAMYGCAAAPDSSAYPGRGATAASQQAGLAAAHVDARPAAIVNGRAVTWSEMKPLLNEAAGGEILWEVILDRVVHDAAGRGSFTIGSDEVAAERKLLLESLSDDPDTALRLLDSLRERQGLGRARFEGLLRRNAALRAMVRDRASITEADLRQLHDVLYGPKRQGRLIVVPNLHAARAALAQVENGETFADVAVKVSTDASAPRGGLLEPISRSDPSYPEALRLALWRLAPGETSPPILLEGQYALLALVAEIPAEDIALEDVRTKLLRRAQINRERMLMDQLVRRLTSNVSVTIFDPALDESWSRTRRRGR